MLQCMKSGMNDQSVAQRVLDHIANGTTDIGEEVWREPVANYQLAGAAGRRDRARAAPLAHAVLSVGGLAGGRLLHRARSGRHAARRGARHRRQGARLPQRLPASRHAGRERLGLHARLRLPLSRLDLQSRRPAAPHPARGGLSRLRQGGASAGADDGERALRPGVRHPGRAGAGRRFARRPRAS